MWRARALTGLLATALICAAAACGGDDSSSSSSAGGEGTLGTVDTMFGTVTVPKPADGELTVVALGWSDAEMALALGVAPVAVYDWQSFGAANKGVGPWATEKFGKVTPTVIANTTQDLNYEQIQSFAPDLILNVRASANKDVYSKLSSIAPTVYAPKDTPDFATSWDVQLHSIAQAMGLTDKGDEITGDVKEEIADAAKANPDFAGHTTVSGTKFGEAYGAYLAGDGRFDILAELGFTQNPPVLKLSPSGFFVSISVENVSALDADVTVILPIGYTLQETENDKLLASLAVVKEGRAIFIDPDSELSGAWSAGSVLSIPVVLDQMVPQLAEAVPTP